MTHEKAFAVGFPFFFISLWCGLCWLMSRISGWSALAKKFRAAHPFVGEKRHLQSGALGWVNYRSCLTVGVGREGLYVSVLPLFAIGSPPLIIPWSSMHDIAKYKMLWLTYASIGFEDPLAARLRIPWKFVEKARPWLDPARLCEPHV